MIDTFVGQDPSQPTHLRVYAEAALGPALLFLGKSVDPVIANWLHYPAEDLASVKFFGLAVAAGIVAGAVWLVANYRILRPISVDWIAARLRGTPLKNVAFLCLLGMIAIAATSGACRPFMIVGGSVAGFFMCGRVCSLTISQHDK